MAGEDLSKLRLDPREKAPGSAGRTALLIVAVAVIVVVAVVLALQGRGDDTAAPASDSASAQGPAAGVFHALPGPQPALAAGGYVEAKRRASLYPGRDGVVERVYASLGQRVRRGEVLLQLDTAIAAAELAGARANVASAQAELEDARVVLRRYEELSRTSSITDEQLDQARYRVSAQAARVEGLEARERLAVAQLALSFLRAPFDGTIVRVDLEPGEVVSFFGAQTGTGGVEIADLSEVWVRVDVPETRIAGVTLGQPAQVVVDALGPQPLAAVVVEIAPVADRQSNTVEVAVRVLDPPPLLRPDMSARVTITSTGATERE